MKKHILLSRFGIRKAGLNTAMCISRINGRVVKSYTAIRVPVVTKATKTNIYHIRGVTFYKQNTCSERGYSPNITLMLFRFCLCYGCSVLEDARLNTLVKRTFKQTLHDIIVIHTIGNKFTQKKHNKYILLVPIRRRVLSTLR